MGGVHPSALEQSRWCQAQSWGRELTKNNTLVLEGRACPGCSCPSEPRAFQTAPRLFFMGKECENCPLGNQAGSLASSCVSKQWATKTPNVCFSSCPARMERIFKSM
jgi:hypothetical protein